MQKIVTEELHWESKYGPTLVYFNPKPKKELVEVTIYFVLKPGCGYKTYHRELSTGGSMGIRASWANNRLDWELHEYFFTYPPETLKPLIEAFIEWHIVNNDLIIWHLEKEEV